MENALAIFGIGAKKKSRPKERSFKIQAAEANRSQIILESMLTGMRVSTTIPGTTNAYTSYDGQVQETYRKYNGFASFGTQQVRAVIDLRTAFVAGEGINVSCEDEQVAKWIETFINRNRLNGNGFINAVKGSELAGQSLMLLKPKEWRVDNSMYVHVFRIPYTTGLPYRPVYRDPMIRDEVIDIQIKKDGRWQSAGFRNYIYVRTGGDDANTEGPSTKVGIVLTDIENYDRAIKDLRRNNHVFARITPVFEVESESEAKSLQKQLNDMKWKIGEAFIGKAKFHYETPERGAHDNLKTELVATIKSISGTTGVPVHWLGYVDLMSNRATAETLYEFIKNATINERAEWEKAIYDLILQAQETYVDAGGLYLPRIYTDFTVQLPLIDFGEFENKIKALSLAYKDEAISIDDYRNFIPGIDPMQTRKAIEREREDAKNQLRSVGLNLGNPEEGDEGNE